MEAANGLVRCITSSVNCASEEWILLFAHVSIPSAVTCQVMGKKLHQSAGVRSQPRATRAGLYADPAQLSSPNNLVSIHLPPIVPLSSA
jgi:hypothetical protein